MSFTLVCVEPGHRDSHVFFAIFNSVAAIMSTVGNSLVLVTIWRTPRLHSPSKVLLAGLALSDLGVGLVAQPTFVITIVARVLRAHCNLYYVFYNIWAASFNFFIFQSFVTLTAISVDRYLALRLHLRYRELVTIKRVLMVLVAIWITVGVLYNCVFQIFYRFSTLFIAPAIQTLCICVTVWCHIQVFKTIRRHQVQIQAQVVIPHNGEGPNLPDIAGYKKSVFNMLFVLVFFLISYIPALTVGVVFSADATKLPSPVLHTVLALLFLNSCVNPALYCWRMREIRHAVKEMMTRLF